MKIENPVSGYFASGRRAHRQAETDRSKKMENVNKVASLGMTESEQALTGKTSEPQKKWLDDYEKSSTQEIERYATLSGISNEQKQSQITHMQLDRQIMEESMRENSWTKAIKSLGYSTEQTTEILGEMRQEDAQNKAAFVGLMKTVGLVTAAAFTGGAGAVVLGGMTASEAEQADAAAKQNDAGKASLSTADMG